ncbi:MAG: TonB family protein [Thermoanaerobaculia bacterium]|nr:TonB family protein [Thermoanaerobaculia bacterium]
MNTREQFGNYLLLKKLGEDPLGETFRAGRIGPQGMEEVVLLRVFNGPAVDGPSFWQKVSDRGGYHEALSSPNIANGVDLGQVNNVPYVVYDYISGKDLASLQKQATERNNPIPADHALLIAERVALGLAVGYETRRNDERALHGAVVPELVMISNEGETRVLGFAVAPGVREAAKREPQLVRYLCPEARAGQPIHKTDDVYSLGILLLELLMGRPVSPEADPAERIVDLTMTPEGSAPPEELQRLLQQSLASRDQRIGDVITWHKTLSKLMFEGQYNPTTFNLAFFMHNLFRDEIEKESQEIEVEKTMEIPVQAGEEAPERKGPTPEGAEPETDLREATGVREDTDVIRDKYGISEEEKASKKRNLVLGIVAAVALVAAAAAGLFFFRDDLFGGGGPEEPPTTAETPATRPDAPPEPVPEAEAAPSDEELAAQREEEARSEAEEAEEREEELQAQIQELLDKRLQETEEEYDREIEALRAELEAARERAAESQERAEREARARRVAEGTEEPSATEPAPETAEETAEPQSPAPGPEPGIEGEERIAEAESREEAPSTETPDAGEEVEESRPAPEEPTPTRMPEEAAPPDAEPAEPEVQRGDLVTMGPGVRPPRLLSKPPARYPPVAQRLRKEATVVVKVLVDENGEVIDTEVAEEAGFGFDREALSVAESSTWRPATKDGVPVKIWWQIPIQFSL